MIRVTIELIPLGVGHAKSTWTAEIENVNFNPTQGEYNYRLSRRGGDVRLPWRHGNISGFPRKRLSAYDLLFRVLRDAVGERNPE